MTPLLQTLLSRIRSSGPVTVAAFMDLALYDEEHGYYAGAAQRSGRAGDFFTSVDVGPLFGELLAVQIDEMWRLLERNGATHFDLVEAGAGNGRLMRDILDAAAARHPELYRHIRVTLVERSASARAEQQSVLAPHAAKLEAATAATLPGRITGAIIANELLDAFPVHVVTSSHGELQEIYVGERDGRLVETPGPLSDPQILDHLPRDVRRAALQGCHGLPPGTRVEVGLAAARWIRAAGASLERGFLLLIDYGYQEERRPARGTMASYRAHVAEDGWLAEPGNRDLTAHVNLTAAQHAAEAAGLTAVGIVDQTYFLTALGVADRLDPGMTVRQLSRRLAAKTLIMPGGLGSTMKVMAFARGLREPALTGLSSGRVT